MASQIRNGGKHTFSLPYFFFIAFFVGLNFVKSSLFLMIMFNKCFNITVPLDPFQAV